jgi:pimeloyl-ACP methyl ester carboxylesterase
MIVSLVLAAIASAPAGMAFYTPPSPLPPGKPGDVIWSRTLPPNDAYPADQTHLLVLYHSVGPNGDVAVSGTVSIPHGTPPAGGWPVMSWSHGTTGNAPLCAPSTYTKIDGERALQNDFVEHGYVVVETDYEGNGTPGIHPYMVATATAHDVADMVIAARHLVPDIGTNWVVAGHSEGGFGAIATAAFGQPDAPDLHLLGAEAFAPASHMLLYFHNMQTMDQPISELSLFLLMIQSYGTYDPDVHLDQLFYPTLTGKLPELQQHCLGYFRHQLDWTSQVPSEMFRRDADFSAIEKDFAANEPGGFHLTVPLLVLQGTTDTMVNPGMSTEMVAKLCDSGTDLTYSVYKEKDHFTLLPASTTESERWASALFAHVTPTSTCGKPPLFH